MSVAGLPQRYRDSVRTIRPGLPLFLYNYTTHQLHGVFEVSLTLPRADVCSFRVMALHDTLLPSSSCRMMLGTALLPAPIVFGCQTSCLSRACSIPCWAVPSHLTPLSFSCVLSCSPFLVVLFCASGNELWGFQSGPDSMGGQEAEGGVALPSSGREPEQSPDNT